MPLFLNIVRQLNRAHVMKWSSIIQKSFRKRQRQRKCHFEIRICTIANISRFFHLACILQRKICCCILKLPSKPHMFISRCCLTEDGREFFCSACRTIIFQAPLAYKFFICGCCCRRYQSYHLLFNNMPPFALHPMHSWNYNRQYSDWNLNNR